MAYIIQQIMGNNGKSTPEKVLPCAESWKRHHPPLSSHTPFTKQQKFGLLLSPHFRG